MELSITVGGVELIKEIVEVDVSDSTSHGQIGSTLPHHRHEPLVIYDVDPMGVFLAVKRTFNHAQMVELESLCREHIIRMAGGIITESDTVLHIPQAEPVVDPDDEPIYDVPVRRLDEPSSEYYEKSEDYASAMAALSSLEQEITVSSGDVV